MSGFNLPATRFLVDHSADLHQEIEEGATAVLLAAMKGSTRHGSDVMCVSSINYLNYEVYGVPVSLGFYQIGRAHV